MILFEFSVGASVEYGVSIHVSKTDRQSLIKIDGSKTISETHKMFEIDEIKKTTDIEEELLNLRNSLTEMNEGRKILRDEIEQ